MQHLSGEIVASGVPSSDLTVLVVSGGAAGACEGGRTIAEAQTDHHGDFVVERRVSYGRVAVIVDEVTVCVRGPECWKVIWERVYGPAKTSIVLRCDLDKVVERSVGNGYCAEEMKDVRSRGIRSSTRNGDRHCGVSPSVLDSHGERRPVLAREVDRGDPDREIDGFLLVLVSVDPPEMKRVLT